MKKVVFGVWAVTTAVFVVVFATDKREGISSRRIVTLLCWPITLPYSMLTALSTNYRLSRLKDEFIEERRGVTSPA